MYIADALYKQILACMPIPCVDLLIVDNAERILLVKRKNEPAANQWWFPGGRIYFNETRSSAARRKLEEECKLHVDAVREIGTFDVILPISGTESISHGISTVFEVTLESALIPALDSQSSAWEWNAADRWLSMDLGPFVRDVLFKHRAAKA